MCGRYNITDDAFTQELLSGLGLSIRLTTQFNIAPTEQVPVIYRTAASATGVMNMRWWLTPSWAPEPSDRYSMFNARLETLDKSRAFKKPFTRQRGVMPASGFIEWKKVGQTKQPYYIQAEHKALCFAAIWDNWVDLGVDHYSCCLITRAANETFAPIHHRMPVMLSEDQLQDWLDPATPKEKLLELCQHPPSGHYRIAQVSSSINNAREKGAVAVQPVSASTRLPDLPHTAEDSLF